MRRTEANMALNIACRHYIMQISNKLELLVSGKSANEEIKVKSSCSCMDDDEFLYYNISSVGLLLTYKINNPIDLYVIVEHFPDSRINKEYAKILSFRNIEEFYKETGNILEFGNLIGDIIYNTITNPLQMLFESGIKMEPYME